MAKEDVIELSGTMTGLLPSLTSRVGLENGRGLPATISGLTEGRITARSN